MERARDICPARQGYVRNAWYVGAWSHEVAAGRTFLRRIMDEPVVFFRGEDGEPIALFDRCPHRGMPLSKGRVRGGTVRCIYHGVVFGGDGACVEIPAQTVIPSKMCVRSYPLVEKWRWIWIWMGDPALADPSLIPDYEMLGIGRPGYSSTPMFVAEMKANYELLHENLLDNSHVSFLHAGMLEDGEVARAEAGGAGNAELKIERDGRMIRTVKIFAESRPSRDVAAFFRVEPGYPYAREFVTETHAPNLNLGRSVYLDPAGARPPSEMITAFPITPGGRDVCYQFHAVSTSYAQEWTPDAIAYVRGIIQQDVEALEAIQQGWEELGDDAVECHKTGDQAGLMFRRMVADMVRDETLAKAAA
jgi:vanillate O-demethylase monooxygenase subunit